MKNLPHMLRLAPALGLSLCLLAAGAASANPAAPTEGEGVDPFLAAALGVLPFASGFYVTDNPAAGILFSAADALMVMAVYTARNTASGDPRNVKAYFILMGANNLLDAWFSARYARASLPQKGLRAPRALLVPNPAGGVTGALRWNF